MAKSYDKRYVKTEKGFVVRVEDSVDNAADSSASDDPPTSRFVSKNNSQVGDIRQSKKGPPPSYRMVVKSEKSEEFATYESVRVCLANLQARMKEDGVTRLRLEVEAFFV